MMPDDRVVMAATVGGRREARARAGRAAGRAGALERLHGVQGRAG